MIRYYYIVALVLVSMGFPLFAKTDATLKPTPSNSSKSGFKTAAARGTTRTPPEPKVQAPMKQAVVKYVDDEPLPESLPEAQRPVGSPILGNRLVAFPAPQSAVPTTPYTAAVRSAAAERYYTADRSATADRSDTTGRMTRNGRLARVTAYWAGEGDYYTGKCISSTGVRLHDGHCAVDPNIIPYGSVVEIAGVGKYLAVDTGSAVISRTAAREAGHNPAERNALVIDVYFESPREGAKFAAGSAKFASVSWWTPRSADTQAKARGLFAAEDWTRIQGKQL